MKIILERNGGLAGIPQRKVLDVSKLSKKQAKKTYGLVQKAMAAKCIDSRRNTTPDRFQYKLTIEAEGDLKELSFSEEKSGRVLAALVAWVEQCPLTDKLPA